MAKKTNKELSAEAEALFNKMKSGNRRMLSQQQVGTTTTYEFEISVVESDTQQVVIKQLFRHDPDSADWMAGDPEVKWVTKQHVSKFNRYVACGGPCNGRRMTEDEGKGFGYVRYNCGAVGQRWRPKWPKAVLVAADHLKPESVVRNPVPDAKAWFNG